MGIRKYLACPEYALSLVSTATLVQLNALGVPFPTRTPFVPYGVLNTAGNKLVVGDGFPSCVWEWADAGLTREVWARLYAFIGSGNASAYVYLRTTGIDESMFANYYGVMQLPPLEPVGYNVRAWQALSVKFSGLVAQ